MLENLSYCSSADDVALLYKGASDPIGGKTCVSNIFLIGDLGSFFPLGLQKPF